jgi:dUTP pyrophosphatase
MEIQFATTHPDAQIPAYKTAGAAGFDLSLVEDVTIAPRTFVKARTGLVIGVPDGHVLIVASRSSNPVKKGITLANSIGVLDSDYCGPEDELFLLLENITDETVELKKGDRVAQGMILPVPSVTFTQVERMAGKNRGGFGTTGQ